MRGCITNRLAHQHTCMFHSTTQMDTLLSLIRLNIGCNDLKRHCDRNHYEANRTSNDHQLTLVELPPARSIIKAKHQSSARRNSPVALQPVIQACTTSKFFLLPKINNSFLHLFRSPNTCNGKNLLLLPVWLWPYGRGCPSSLSILLRSPLCGLHLGRGCDGPTAYSSWDGFSTPA